MATYMISIPTSIIFEVTDTELQGKNIDELTEDDLINRVFEYFGKYITIDARQLGYENYQIIDSYEEQII